MKNARVRGVRGAGLLFCLVLAGCSDPPTQIIVMVTSDMTVPTMLNEVKVEARGPSMVPQSRTVDLDGQTDLPVTAGMRPSSDIDLDPLLVTIFGFGRGGPIERRVWTGWRAGESRVLEIELTDDCANVECSQLMHLTCIDGTCQNGDVDSGDLPLWDGESPPSLPVVDAGL